LQKKGRPKILIVEDETEITDFLSDYFREKGYTVHVLNSGAEILTTYKQFQPNLVLLDVNLGSRATLADGTEVFDGIQALEKIRSCDPSAKVIMVTGVGHKDIVDQATSHGASGFITKPLSLEYLETTVTEKVQELLST